ncbi:MAG: branched-chain amino acid aminotransferase [Firmicutes bacterium]|nr:branched-chain amino acid aminotransferase [Bacillota bacterium]
MKIKKIAKPKTKPQGVLGFGKYFTDHMVVMEYDNGKWEDPQIMPYAPLSLDPSTCVFHYAQGIFEGLKAYKAEDGSVRLFRPRDNFRRMNDSASRVCIPSFDENKIYDALIELIKLDVDWIPSEQGTSLYIRPSIIAIDNTLGVHPSHKYLFFIIMCPVGAYYASGFGAIKLFVEEQYIRAAKGGTGGHKVIGNYAASLKAASNATARGYAQVMWLDAKEHKYIEEVGSMNIFFVFGNELITPALSGSILPGITRLSVIELAKSKGWKVTERPISIDEVVKGVSSGKCSEIFGTGTAAVISPVGAFLYNGKEHIVGDSKTGKVASSFFDELTGIQTGKITDKFGWSIKI